MSQRISLGVFAILATSHALAHESTLPPFLAQAPLRIEATDPAATIPLTLELMIDGATEPVAGLVRITPVATGKPLVLAAHLGRPLGWFSLPARATVHVPRGGLKIEACRGIETEIATLARTIAADAGPQHVRLALRRFHDAAARGFVSGNTHLHLRLNSPGALGGANLRNRAEAEAYLLNTAQADAVDLVFVSHLERAGEDRNYISNEFIHADLAGWSTDRLRFVAGEEHRHEGGRSMRRGGPDELRYGHVLFLDLPRLVQPVSYGAIFNRHARAGDSAPMRDAIADARKLHATIIWCHGRQGTEDVPNWVDGLLHAQNIYDGGNDGTVETLFYPYLNAGLRVPFSTGTDWGVYDLSRVLVLADGAGAVSSRAFLDNLARGRSIITNGTFLEFTVDGRAIGETLDLPAAGRVKIHGRAIGRDDFTRIEVVFNGTVVAKAERRVVGGHHEAELDTNLDLNEPGWLALRIPTTRPYNDRTQYTGAGANLFGKALFAHTSAVYVNVAGRSVRQPAAVRTLVADLEASIATIKEKGAFASERERDALLAIYRDAIRTLQGRK